MKNFLNSFYSKMLENFELMELKNNIEKLQNYPKVTSSTLPLNDLNFILFDYAKHFELGIHNIGDFIQSIATKNAISKALTLLGKDCQLAGGG